MTASEGRAFKCCPADVDPTAAYYPALRTMAMGDVNAVEYGQAAHTLVALQRGLRFEDMLVMRGRPPRGPVAVGLVIDDWIALEQVPDERPIPELSSAIADDMVQAYEAAGLVANSKKRFRDEVRSHFWGISLDGGSGLVRAQLERVIPAALLTARLARPGFGERKLLETLAEMWTAILHIRRPCMCILEAFFEEIQTHEYGQPFALSAEGIQECWMLTTLAPLFCSDLRAAVHPEVALVDASNEAEAEVVTEVEKTLAEELARQRLSRAAWAKLLSPLQALRRMHGVSRPADEVPEDEQPAARHPLWFGVVRSSQFKLVKKKKIKKRVHINVSELQAAIDSLERRCFARTNCRHLLGSDSQVVLGRLVRGRSSSKALNSRLRALLPTWLVSNGYVCALYIPTELNVADDPTRHRVCRGPDRPLPDWIARISEGDYTGLDAELAQIGISDRQVARLPQPEPVQSAPVSPVSERTRVRREHWRSRVAKKDGSKVKSPPAAVSGSPWLP